LQKQAEVPGETGKSARALKHQEKSKYPGKNDPLDTDCHDGCLDNNVRVDIMLSTALNFIGLCNDVQWKLAHEYLDIESEQSSLGKSFSSEYLRNTYAGPLRCKGLCGWISEEDNSDQMTYFFHCESMKSNAFKLSFLKSAPSRIVDITAGCFPVSEVKPWDESCLHPEENEWDVLGTCAPIEPTCEGVMYIQLAGIGVGALGLLGMYILYRLYHARNMKQARMSAAERSASRERNKAKLDKAKSRLKKMKSRKGRSGDLSGMSTEDLQTSIDEERQKEQNKAFAKAVSIMHVVGASDDAFTYESKYGFNCNTIFVSEDGVVLKADPRRSPTINTGGNVKMIAEENRLKKLADLKSKNRRRAARSKDSKGRSKLGRSKSTMNKSGDSQTSWDGSGDGSGDWSQDGNGVSKAMTSSTGSFSGVATKLKSFDRKNPGDSNPIFSSR
jgi:hypothetical protein